MVRQTDTDLKEFHMLIVLMCEAWWSLTHPSNTHTLYPIIVIGCIKRDLTAFPIACTYVATHNLTCKQVAA